MPPKNKKKQAGADKSPVKAGKKQDTRPSRSGGNDASPRASGKRDPRRSATATENDAAAGSRLADAMSPPAAPESESLRALREAKLAVDAADDASSDHDAPAAPWVDDDEDALRGPAAARAALAPSWAASALAAAEDERDDAVAAGGSGAKRPRGETGDDVLDGVAAVLARAEPVVRQSRSQRGLAAPKPEATVLYPKGGVKDLVWHPSGEVLVSSTSSAIETIHCAGSYTERIAAHKVEKSRIGSVAMCPSGESVVALMQNAHVPLQLNLRTGKVKPLHFMDTRTSAAYKVSVVGRRVDSFPLLVAFKPGDAARQRFAMPVGSYVHLGSVSDATMAARLTLPAEVEDCVFMGDHQLGVAAGNRVLVYDVRHTAKFVRQFTDEGAMKANRLSYHAGVLAVGSTSGTVNTYVGESTKPAKTFMNLSASVDLLVAGDGSAGPSLVMGSSAQANGFRFVNTTTMTVASSFPEVGMKHGMVQCLAFNPVHPVFSVGEASRVVNYAC